MGLVFRWLIRLAAALIVLVAAVIGLVYFLASQSLPEYDRSVVFEALRQLWTH